MKLKSLLLGSAAVLVAATGAARAADAIVVEPEPVEYVRICDAYGAGWFYIPGTETCLKFDGEIRVQYSSTHYHDYDSDLSDHGADFRARLNVRANNETEYGTLSSRVRFRGNSGGGEHYDEPSYAEGPGNASGDVDWAVISLAGFRVGYSDDYWTTAGGYGLYYARYEGPYGFNKGLYLDYTYAANGWAFTVGIEDGNSSGEAGQPDVYAGVTYSGSGWYLAGIYYQDSSESAGAWKVRADYDFGNGFKFGGWYMADDGDTDYVKGHVWAVTAQYQLTENMLLFGGYSSYDDTFNVSGGRNPSSEVSSGATDNEDMDVWTVGLAWNIVPGLLIQPEYRGVSFQNEDNANFGQFSLRIVRSF